jgi:hypothetical protein
MIKLYAVKDIAAGTTNQPFSFQTDRDAIEGLRAVANDENSTIGKHPEDFELYHLGEYDMRSMEFDLLDKPILVIGAKELLQ